MCLTQLSETKGEVLGNLTLREIRPVSVLILARAKLLDYVQEPRFHGLSIYAKIKIVQKIEELRRVS